MIVALKSLAHENVALERALCLDARLPSPIAFGPLLAQVDGLNRADDGFCLSCGRP
jgi:hypothetical protein